MRIEIEPEFDGFNFAILFADVKQAQCVKVSWFHGHDTFLQVPADCGDLEEVLARAKPFEEFWGGNAEANDAIFVVVRVRFGESLSYVNLSMSD